MIRFHVLGTLELRVEPGVDTRSLLAHSKHTALLAYLAVSNGGLHRREKLAAMLWPELDDARSRNALSKALHSLRRTVGDGAVLLRGNDAVGIDSERLWCDGAAFERAIELGEREEALGLYRRGEVLEGFSIDGSSMFEQWLDSVRLRFRQAAAKAASGLANDAEKTRDLAASVRWSRVAIEISPHDETVLRQLLARLVASGDRAGALAAYHAFAERLDRDLEAEPSPETRVIVDALRIVKVNGNGHGNGDSNGTRNGLKPRHGEVSGTAPDDDNADKIEFARVTAVGELAGLDATNPKGTRRGVSRWRSRRPLALAAAAAIASIALMAIPGSRFQSTEKVDRGLVAVSPIRLETGDSSLKSVANMATEGIVQQLAQSSSGVIDLRNTGKGGEDAAGRSGDESRTHARAAGAGTVVGGRMYAKGDSVYANVQITDARSGRVLHQLDQYASPASNPYLILGKMKEGVAGAVAALSDTLYLPWSRAHSRPPTFAAFSEFLLALDAMANSNLPDAGFKHLKAAIALDTAFAEAKIWLLAGAYVVPEEERKFVDSVRLVAVAQRAGLGEFDKLSLDRVLAFIDGRWEDAYVVSRRLVEIAPTTPDAHFYLAQSAMATRRYAEAVRTIDGMARTKAWLEYSPALAHWDLQAHRLLGDLQGAHAHWKRARAAKPPDFLCMQGATILGSLGREQAVDSLITECLKGNNSPGVADAAWWNAGRGLRSQGYTDAARRAFRRSMALIAESGLPERTKTWLIGTRQCELGEWKSAYVNLLASLDSTDGRARSVVGVTAANAGDTALATATLKWLEEHDRGVRTRVRHLEERAYVTLALGRRNEALELLRQAMANGDSPASNGWYVRFELQPLQNDPRFQAMVRPVR